MASPPPHMRIPQSGCPTTGQPQEEEKKSFKNPSIDRVHMVFASVGEKYRFGDIFGYVVDYYFMAVQQ